MSRDAGIPAERANAESASPLPQPRRCCSMFRSELPTRSGKAFTSSTRSTRLTVTAALSRRHFAPAAVPRYSAAGIDGR